MKRARIDKPLGILIGILIISGCLIFASAVFGIIGKGDTHASSVVFNHLVLGVGLGLVALFVCAILDYRIWRTYSIYLFLAAVVATALVFVPQIGFSHGGGTRWLHIFGVSFQPSEALKLGAIFAAAAYCAYMRAAVSYMLYGLGGLAGVLALPIIILVLQPDIGTLGIICISVLSVFFAAGMSWKQVGTIVVLALLAFGVLIQFRPYMYDRMTTFLRPAENQHDESYQLQQSLIAIGSGEFLGRGIGQGIQKFTYLPEPMGDSIFAVAAEETGFVGAIVLVSLFLAFALRGYTVAARAPDLFGSLLAVGISTYLAGEAFINISAMLGIAPLTGIPLTFMSQGGSAMLVSLAAAGILLSISRRQKSA